MIYDKHINRIWLKGIIAVIVLAILISSIAFIYSKKREQKYDYAISLMELEPTDYEKACEIFDNLGVFRDSSIMANEARYRYALELLNQPNPDIDEAETWLLRISGEYKDKVKLLSILDKYRVAIELLYDEDYENAIEQFSSLFPYINNLKMVNAAKYGLLRRLNEEGRYVDAVRILGQINYDEDLFIEGFDMLCNKATTLYNDGFILDALSLFEELSIYDSSNIISDEYDTASKTIEKVKAELYIEAIMQFDANNYDAAKRLFILLGDYKEGASYIRQIDEIQKRLEHSNTFSADALYSAAITNEGKIRITGDGANVLTNDKEYINDWNNEDIVSISAGTAFVAGLRRDGSVVIKWSEDLEPFENQTWQEWKNIISIASGEYHIVGLNADGEVKSLGYKKAYMSNDFGRTDVNDWNGIIAISAGSQHTVGLKENGSVVVAGHRAAEQQKLINQLIAKENPVIAVAGGGNHEGSVMTSFTAMLRSDGTVRVVDGSGRIWSEVEKWYDPAINLDEDERIVSISAGAEHLVGLRYNGKVVSTDDTERSDTSYKYWRKIVAVSAGKEFTLALREDGTLLSCGYHYQYQRPKSQGETDDMWFGWKDKDMWTDIVLK